MLKNILKYSSWITGLIVLAVYIYTMAPTVIGGDCGELAAVQATLGIAHPTGYPLFTIAGYLFSQIPFPFGAIYKLNLLSAVWCALSIVFLVSAIKLVFNNFNKFQSISSRSEVSSPEQSFELPDFMVQIFSVFGGLFFAFSLTFWLQSTSVEVYSLNIFVVILIIFFSIKIFTGDFNSGRFGSAKYWTVISILFGIGLANHLTIIYILPSLLFLYFAENKFKLQTIKSLLLLSVLSLATAAFLYSYLIIRASQSPVINWGDPSTFTGLMHHVSGSLYRDWIFSSGGVVVKQLKSFLDSLFLFNKWEFGIGIFLSLVGAVYSIFILRKFFVYVILLFLSSVLISSNYAIVDIDSYYLPAYLSLAVFAPVGLLSIIRLFKQRKKAYFWVGTIALLFIASQVFINLPKANKNNFTAFEQFTKALMESTQDNSIIVTNGWNNFLFPSYYFQFVEGFRNDIEFVCLNLREDWYKRQVNKRLGKEIFWEGETLNFTLNKREVYVAVTSLEQISLPPGFYFIPDIFLFKIVNTRNYIPAGDPDFEIYIPENIYDSNLLSVENYIGSMLENRAMYELRNQKTGRAIIYIQKIKSTLPHFELSDHLIYYMKQNGLDDYIPR